VKAKKLKMSACSSCQWSWPDVDTYHCWPEGKRRREVRKSWKNSPLALVKIYCPPSLHAKSNCVLIFDCKKNAPRGQHLNMGHDEVTATLNEDFSQCLTNKLTFGTTIKSFCMLKLPKMPVMRETGEV